MKTIDQLQEFYSNELLPDLRLLEQQRKSVVSRIMLLAAVILGAVLIFSFILISRSASGFFVFYALAIGAVIFVLLCRLLTKDYVSGFKAKVIRKIVQFIDEHLSYEPRGYIPKSTFMMSKIFKQKPNRYKGDDYVSGKIGATEIEFCELDAVHESGSGKNRSRVTIFKGMFFIADFNKDFTSETVVLPDTAEKLFGRLGQKLQSLNVFRGQLIKLEDPEFERFFVVYGDDQVQARYILSTSLMERIVEFKKKTDRKVYISFVGSKVYVAVSFRKDLFEPKLFRTVLSFEPVKEYFEDLQLATGIVDDLNLNTRIWSKG